VIADEVEEAEHDLRALGECFANEDACTVSSHHAMHE
jgi:hypothetical protein